MSRLNIFRVLESLNIFNPKNRKKLLFYMIFVVMIFPFVRFELELIDDLQLIFSEPILSGDIRIFEPKGMLLGNEFFGIEKNDFPILYLYVLGERFPIHVAEYSIHYIPSMILKISWKICGDIRCNRICDFIDNSNYICWKFSF